MRSVLDGLPGSWSERTLKEKSKERVRIESHLQGPELIVSEGEGDGGGEWRESVTKRRPSTDDLATEMIYLPSDS